MGSRTAVIRAALVEVLSEPLSLLLTLSALALMLVGAIMHCHNFGQPTRMACEAGLSAQLMGGILLGLFAAVRAFRREEESGTLAMTLAHPISRASFFISKCLGVLLGVALLVWTLFCATITLARAAYIGGLIAAAKGDIPRLWGPAVALVVAIILLPLFVGAVRSRFGNGRFVYTSLLTMIILSSAALLYPWEWNLFVPLTVSFVLLLIPTTLFTLIAASAAVRLKDRHAVALTLGLLIIALPLVGNYYPTAQVFRQGWTLKEALFAVSAAVPLICGFVLLGVHFMNRKDIG